VPVCPADRALAISPIQGGRGPLDLVYRYADVWHATLCAGIRVTPVVFNRQDVGAADRHGNNFLPVNLSARVRPVLVGRAEFHQHHDHHPVQPVAMGVYLRPHPGGVLNGVSIGQYHSQAVVRRGGVAGTAGGCGTVCR